MSKENNYGISITYSWGDEEPVESYGFFATEEDAYKKACELAGREAYVQNEEFSPENTCTVYFDAAKKAIDLHYESDNSYCYYRIVDLRKDEGVI